MGNLLPSYKKTVFDEIANNISSNVSQYYAFVSNPIEYIDGTPVLTKDDYSSVFEYSWNMIFGKKIKVNDIIPVIKKNIWSANTVYDRYDNTSETIYDKDNYYVITEPEIVGGNYNVYKCINNANGSFSVIKPNLTQISNFITLPDNYEWRYITTISNELYNKFSTPEYAPIYPNTVVSSGAANNSGVDVIVVANGGGGYTNYANGVVQTNPNTTLIGIANNSSEISGFFNNTSIYLYNENSTSSQLKNVKNYVVNNSGKWIITENPVNTSLISSGSTQYSISPKVVFETDGRADPIAFSVVNSSINSISSVVLFDSGSNITWANVYIESTYGSGANLYAIVAPIGGHGRDPAVELNMKGYCVSFTFENDENNTITTSDINYNKIGIIKNPYTINTNGSKSIRFSSNTYSSVLKANVNYTFTKGEVVTGSTSKARGTVVFSNSSQVYLVGDKNFSNNEFVSNSTSSNVTTINIVSRGDIYTKDIIPLYVQNINNVTRQENQSESFKLIIKL